HDGDVVEDFADFGVGKVFELEREALALRDPLGHRTAPFVRSRTANRGQLTGVAERTRAGVPSAIGCGAACARAFVSFTSVVRVSGITQLFGFNLRTSTARTRGPNN